MVDLPDGKNVVGVKWIYKIKHKSDGSLDKYKARLVAKGYSQKEGVDYEETFAPTTRMTTLRLIVALTTHHGWPIFQMDVKAAFLNGELEEEVYVEQPLWFVEPCTKENICLLKKVLYGLKQTP